MGAFPGAWQAGQKMDFTFTPALSLTTERELIDPARQRQGLLVFNVIPAKVGIQRHLIPANMLGPGNVDSRFRGNDGNLAVQI